jgi:predicted PolB exonuclease-like 3'-5' exonuclease
VWNAYREGRLAEIRNYCETDVVNTYLVFLRFQLMRGILSPEHHQAQIEAVRGVLGKAVEPHWQEFMRRWDQARAQT